jgi:hypothetical protein
VADVRETMRLRRREERGEERQEMVGLQLAIRLAPDSQRRFAADGAICGRIGRLEPVRARGEALRLPDRPQTFRRDLLIRNTYSPKKGRGLFLVLVALRQWGEDFFFELDEPHAQLADERAGSPV